MHMVWVCGYVYTCVHVANIASVQALSCQHSREKGRRKRRERKERHYTTCCNLLARVVCSVVKGLSTYLVILSIY